MAARQLIFGIFLALWTAPLAAAAGPAGSARPEAGPGLIAPVAVFGSDDRVPVPARKDWIAQRVGLLFNNQTRTVCTAFCVADNVIATAAHCLARSQAGSQVRYTDFNFARNFDRARTFVRIEGADSGAAPQHISTGDFRLRVRPPIDAAFDWALMRVPRNTCPVDSLRVQTLTPEELIAQSQAGRIFQISYHRDWAPWKPAYSKPCRIDRDFDAVKWSSIAADFMKPEIMVLHTCDTGGASSGSPILLESGNGATVVAINVGTYVQSKVVTQNGQVAVRQRNETIANTAVNASAFAERIALLRSARILASGGPMRELQALLRTRGHDPGPLDGAYGTAVRTAIEAYERASGLPVTGLATEALLRRLMQETRIGAVPPPPPATPTPRR